MTKLPKVEKSWLDSMAIAVSPRWGASRIQNKMRISAFESNGYVVPGSSRKSMKGITVSANSADADTIDKLDGTRALSRDMAMNSPLAISILRRHRTDIVCAGLQLQSNIDHEVLGISSDQAEKIERIAEKEFEIWSESFYCDWDQQQTFGEMQASAIFNMFLSGDNWTLKTYDEPDDKDFPYGTRIKIIEADLVRNPMSGRGDATIDISSRDIQGGVEKDSKGRVVAIYVWDGYDSEVWNFAKKKIVSWQRIPIYTENGKRQIWQLADLERLGQRRGIALLAAAFEPLKQITRLANAQLMNALVSAFFSVFVKDTSGLGSVMATAITPDETVLGGGTYGPTNAPATPVNQEDGNDLEMGSGNINYLDQDQDVTIADPKKVDTGFADFWNALANQICAAGGMPLEKAMLHYTTSYTAARAALLDAWKGIVIFRKLLERRLCRPAYEAFFEEAVLKGRINAPKFFDDIKYKRAWLGSRWVGIGMGSLDPQKEAKANLFNLRTNLVTHEDAYQQNGNGRWDTSIYRRSREEKLIKKLIPNSETVVDETVSTQDKE